MGTSGERRERGQPVKAAGRKALIYLVALLMWPYFVALGVRELWRMARRGRPE